MAYNLMKDSRLKVLFLLGILWGLKPNHQIRISKGFGFSFGTELDYISDSYTILFILLWSMDSIFYDENPFLKK